MIDSKYFSVFDERLKDHKENAEVRLQLQSIYDSQPET